MSLKIDENLEIGDTGKSLKDILNKKQNILWKNSEGSFMTDTQTVTLSQKISEQENGIVLVFQRYDVNAGAVAGWGFTTFFVPKSLINIAWDGVGCNFQICRNNAFEAYKYLYIYDDKIKGIADNEKTVNSVNNKNHVLVAVVGV